MSKDRIDGGWKQIKADARRQWGRTRDDAVEGFENRRGHVAKVLGKYGFAQEETKSMLTDWPRRFKDKRRIKDDGS